MTSRIQIILYRNLSRILLYCGLILIVVQVTIILLTALHNAGYFNGIASDGVFQLYDPLRRLDGGQTFGRNFFFFHGPLTALLHYPIYALLGHNIFSTVFAEWTISPLLWLLLFFIYFRTILPRKFGLQLVLTFVLFKLSQVWFFQVVSPGNALLGVRMCVPFLIGLIIFYNARKEYSFRRINLLWDILLPLFIAIALMAGIEFGSAALASLLIVNLLTTNSGILKKSVNAIRFSLICLLFTYLLASIISFGHAASLLKYMFLTLPGDQAWYFGVPPNKFITNFRTLFDDPLLHGDLGFLLILLGAAYIQYKKLKLSKANLQTVIYFLIFGTFSLVSIFGYRSGDQDYAIRIYSIFASGILLSSTDWKKYIKVTKKISTKKITTFHLSFFDIPVSVGLQKIKIPIYKRNLERLALFGIALGIAAVASFAFNESSQQIHNQIAYNRLINKRPVVLGSHLSPEWEDNYKAYLSGLRGIKKSNDLWSTYSGMPEAIINAYNPSGYDYIIHALGKTARSKYAADFERIKPHTVITLRQPYFSYENWLQQESWDFYEQIYINYHIVSKSKAVIVWVRNDESHWIYSNAQKWQGEVYLDVNHQIGTTFNFPFQENHTQPQLYTVEIDYRVHNRWLKVPFVGRLQRYFVLNSGSIGGTPVSLAPYDNSFRFPLVVTSATRNPINFGFLTYSLPHGAHLQAISLKWRLDPIKDPNELNLEYALSPLNGQPLNN